MEFIKIPLTQEMKDDFKKCANTIDDGEAERCNGCSMNGRRLGCMGAYVWGKDGGDSDER